MANEKKPDGDSFPKEKISTGPNARPLDGSLSQTGPGLPDDSSGPIEISPEEEEKIAEQIRKI